MKRSSFILALLSCASVLIAQPAPMRETVSVTGMGRSSVAPDRVTAAVASSYLPFGTAGTLIGLAAGSVITGTAAWYIERLIRRSADITRMKAKVFRQRGRPPTERLSCRSTWRHAGSFGSCGIGSREGDCAPTYISAEESRRSIRS